VYSCEKTGNESDGGWKKEVQFQLVQKELKATIQFAGGKKVQNKKLANTCLSESVGWRA
jgi:hypothetical protein